MDPVSLAATFNNPTFNTIFNELAKTDPIASRTDELGRFLEANGASKEVVNAVIDNGTTSEEIDEARKWGLNFNTKLHTKESTAVLNSIKTGQPWQSSAFATNRNIVPVPGTSITMNKPSANVLNGLIALGDELGINMREAFTSGHRDHAKQQSLLDRWHAGDPDIVYKPAQPGNHPHGYGDTFDAGFTDKEKDVLKEYERRNPGVRFIQPVDGDWVHYQIIGTPQPQQQTQQSPLEEKPWDLAKWKSMTEQRGN